MPEVRADSPLVALLQVFPVKSVYDTSLVNAYMISSSPNLREYVFDGCQALIELPINSHPHLIQE
jgi:hypothetical protein